MPCRTSFGDIAVRAEKLPENTFPSLSCPLEPAIMISKTSAAFLLLRTLNGDVLFRMNRGYQQRVDKRYQY
ncbi:hypothetical protein CC86DRAFT_375130 [Ophiobolus disseminans]|uniref:Uncharacterized protein n=1 Tax=Ophiobolus disseminans TaxID=1469910 RepID=A0A6A6ZH76_9PLEO|nr:hypothetical protein CC86DRAFT_375130 [Ophiobolus disseminans]